jgi:hypothetical protein
MHFNIVTRFSFPRDNRGPAKVLKNTIKGLELNRIEYTVSPHLDTTAINWIQDSPLGLIEAGFINQPVIVGPNVAVLPSDLPKFRFKVNTNSVYLFPSLWPLQHWEKMGFSEAKMRIWSSGVDVDVFHKLKRSNYQPKKILVYFKNRDRATLNRVLTILCKNKFDYVVLEYGNYTEDHYLKILAECFFAVWISGSESQGYAMLEAMATGLPIIVCDINKISENVNTMRNVSKTFFPSELDAVKVSASPYFSNQCGYIVSDIEYLSITIDRLLDEYQNLNPAEYVSINFDLKKCAYNLIDIAQSIQNNYDTNSKTIKPNLSQILRLSDLITRKTAWTTLLRKLKNYGFN